LKGQNRILLMLKNRKNKIMAKEYVRGMKNKILLFAAGSTAMFMASCLGTDYTETIIKDAQIASLTLSHDSITGLSDVKFTIDQLNGLIFNKDSMPLGTVVGKVICNLEYVASVYGVAATQVIQESAGDTIWWNGSDSLDFSQPVRFTVTAYDGVTTKSYLAQVNIHQVNPDSMVWEPYAAKITGQSADELKVIQYSYEGTDAYLMYIKASGGNRLYYSPVSDATTWHELPLSGLPANADIARITEYDSALYAPADNALYRSVGGLAWSAVEGAPAIKTLLGVVNKGRKTSSILAAIVGSGDSFRFAGMDTCGAWTPEEDREAVPGDFPVSGFASYSYGLMYNEYLAVVAGKDRNGAPLNSVWATADAQNWAVFDRADTVFYEKRSGAMLARYDDKLCLIGGIDAEGKALKDMYFSLDNGVTWSQGDSLTAFPPEYAARGYASVLVDSDNYMLIFGGKTGNNAKHADEIWRGRIYRLGF
jgi:hypothetical protein